MSNQTEIKITEIIKKYCKPNTFLKIAFTSSKISNYFSLKDKSLSGLKSNVVYLYTCIGCNSKYVGYTTRYLTTRIEEHLNIDKKSHVFQHLTRSIFCKDKSSSKSFKILDTAKSEYALKQKESMYIKWLSPELNIQKTNRLILSIDV